MRYLFEVFAFISSIIFTVVVLHFFYLFTPSKRGWLATQFTPANSTPDWEKFASYVAALTGYVLSFFLTTTITPGRSEFSGSGLYTSLSISGYNFNGWLIIIYSIIFCFSFPTFSEVCFVPFPLVSVKTFGSFFYGVFHLYLRWNQGWIYRNQPTCYRHWECAWCLCVFFRCTFHRPYLYSRYWTGTSLQVRLMQGVFSNANDITGNCFLMIFPHVSLHRSSSPILRRRIWPIVRNNRDPPRASKQVFCTQRNYYMTICRPENT